MLALKIVCLFLLLPFLFGEAVLKGASHFIYLVCTLFYTALLKD
jgi:hypothetical protein